MSITAKFKRAADQPAQPREPRDYVWHAMHALAEYARKYKFDVTVYARGDSESLFTSRQTKDPKIAHDVYERFTRDNHVGKASLRYGFRLMPYTGNIELGGEELELLASGEATPHDFAVGSKLERRQEWLRNRSKPKAAEGPVSIEDTISEPVGPRDIRTL